MGKTKLTQVPLYLQAPDVTDLDRLSFETKHTKQALLREGLADLFTKYRAQGFLRPDAVKDIDAGTLRREVAREIRAGASIDLDALVTAGDLIAKGRGWYVLRDIAVLSVVTPLVREIEERRKGSLREIRVRLDSPKRWKKLAAKLRQE